MKISYVFNAELNRHAFNYSGVMTSPLHIILKIIQQEMPPLPNGGKGSEDHLPNRGAPASKS